MNSITIGQYIPGDSWLHKLDPRLKIILVILWMVIIFVIPNIYGMLGCLLFYFLIFFTTGLPFKRILKGLKPIVFLLLFTFILQLIYTTEGKELFSIDFHFGLYQLLMMLGLFAIFLGTRKFVPFHFLYFLLFVLGLFALQLFSFSSFAWADYTFRVYEGGLIRGSYIFIRIVLMVGITSLLTFSTMSTDINNGLEAILSPLKYLHIPVGVFAMIFSLTLRFIPLLFDETNKIMKAQASRGVDFSEGSLKDKVTQIISLLVPMFVVSFNKAEDLANAMETRGYVVGAKRTHLDLLKLEARDYITLAISVIALVGVICWNVLI